MAFFSDFDAGKLRELLEIAFYAVYLIGIPIVAVRFLIQQRALVQFEREKRYIETNNSYIEFLKLAIRHPELDALEYPAGPLPQLNMQQQLQQFALFNMLTSIIERAYLMYRKGGVKDVEEWNSWDAYVDLYMQKPNYRAFIGNDRLAGGFEAEFLGYMREKLQKYRR
jgi:hypothetical protein